MNHAHSRMCRVSVAAALAIALAVSAAPAAAAGYLKLGDIKGEVKAWSWGAKDGAKGGNVEFEWKVEEGESAPPRPGGTEDIATAPAGTASGQATGKRQHKPLTVAKPVDKATPKLAEAIAKGKAAAPGPRPGQGMLAVLVPAGTCVAGTRHASAEFGTGSRVYTMADVVVTSCSPAPSSGGEQPMESMSLNYAKITW